MLILSIIFLNTIPRGFHNPLTVWAGGGIYIYIYIFASNVAAGMAQGTNLFWLGQPSPTNEKTRVRPPTPLPRCIFLSLLLPFAIGEPKIHF